MTARPLPWMAGVRDHPDRPTPTQRHVLLLLALRLDWKDGGGYVSASQLAADAECHRSTVHRALAWARTAGLIDQTQRGGRRGDRAIASEWQLSERSQCRTGDTLGDGQQVTGDTLRTGPNVAGERPQRRTGATPSRPVSINTVNRAECPTCHGKFLVRTDGRLRTHGPRSHRCIGSLYVIDREAWDNRQRRELPVRLGDFTHAVSHRGGVVHRDELARILMVTRGEVDLVAAVAFKRGLVDLGDAFVFTPGRRGMAKR